MTCKQYTYNVPSGESMVLVGLSPSSFVAQKYILTIEDSISQRAAATELFVSYSGDEVLPSPAFIRYATVGSEIDYGFDVIYNPTTAAIEIIVTNNEVSPLRFDLSEQGTIS